MPETYATYKTLTLSELAQEEPPPYIVDGFLRKHTITLLSSEPHVGKTMLMLDLMLCMETRAKFLKTFDVPIAASSIFIALDSPKWDIAGQLKKLALGHGIDPLDMAMWDSRILTRKEARLTIFDAKVLDWLKDIRSTGIDVLFIDTHRRIHTANENDSGEMSAVMNQIERFVDVLGFTVVISTHVGKPMGVDRSVNYQVRGSTVISGSIDYHYSLKAGKNDTIIVNGVSKRRGESKGSGDVHLKFTDHPGGALTIDPLPSSQNEAEAALIEVLSNGPMTKAEAGLASGLSYWKVQKALTNLLAANRIRQREDKKWELSSSLLV